MSGHSTRIRSGFRPPIGASASRGNVHLPRTDPGNSSARSAHLRAKRTAKSGLEVKSLRDGTHDEVLNGRPVEHHLRVGHPDDVIPEELQLSIVLDVL